MTDQIEVIKAPKKRGRPKGSKGLVGNPNFLCKFNQALAEKICDLIEDGMTIHEIVNKYKAHGMVDEKTIYRWQRQFPDFKQAVSASYSNIAFRLVDEMEALSKEELQLRQYTEDDSLADVRAEALKRKERREAIKVRLKAIDILINKVLPKIVSELRAPEQSKLVQLPPIQIINYSEKPKNES